MAAWVIGGGALACGSGAAATPEGGPVSTEPALRSYEPCAVEEQVGEFVIELASGFTRVGGKVEDGVAPQQVPVERAAGGECRLLTPPRLLCDPGCPSSTETCSEGNQCVPLPNGRDVGTVTVQGLVVPLRMSANPATKSYSNPAVPRLPPLGFAAGADLRLSSSGGDYAPFELRGWGVSLLEVTAEPIQITEGNPMSLSWGVPEDTGPAYVQLQLNINNHGSNKAWLECAFADTGSGEIPAALVDELLAVGRSGFPTLTLTRQSASSRVIEPGCVQLLVTSQFSTDVEVPGVISCNSSSECPVGQNCLPLERYCQ